jgi:hypothetical protein
MSASSKCRSTKGYEPNGIKPARRKTSHRKVAKLTDRGKETSITGARARKWYSPSATRVPLEGIATYSEGCRTVNSPRLPLRACGHSFNFRLAIRWGVFSILPPLCLVFCISIESCLPSPRSGSGWLHEIKHEDYRLMARRDPVGIRLITRRGNDWWDGSACGRSGEPPQGTVLSIDGQAVLSRAAFFACHV